MPERITYLINRRVTGQISDAEAHELNDLLIEDNREAIAAIMAELLASDNNVLSGDRTGWEQRIRQVVNIDLPLSAIKSVNRVHFMRRWGWAAAVIILFGMGAYLWGNNKLKVINNKSAVAEKKDIMPGTNRAVLTINNNQSIDLAANKTGININNTITYNDGEKIADGGQLLQLTTPRGGQYQAVLPDGSKVWLNAASSIKFPSKFSKNERRVEVTGEAYFEVEKDASRPFKVSGGGQEIEVLGTSFNINIYNDEPTKKTTLITGSIKITNNNQTAILQPGQQANISIIPITQIKQITVQTDEVLAWKNDAFNFDHMDLPAVMRQLSRWYDLDIKYEGVIPSKEFRGKLSRKLNLSDVLELLSTFKLKFRVEGKTLIVGNK